MSKPQIHFLSNFSLPRFIITNFDSVTSITFTSYNLTRFNSFIMEVTIIVAVALDSFKVVVTVSITTVTAVDLLILESFVDLKQN